MTILDGQAAGHGASGHNADQDRPKPPCHGPGCSNQPSTPFAPPTAPTSHFTDVKACLVGAGDPDVDGSHGVAPPASDLDPVDRPAPIFHPPRA